MKRAAAEAVLDAAEEVFGERGIDASMELIAARAGVAVGTLYNHFANREALINALMQARRDEMMSSASTAIARFKGKPFAEQLHGVISALVDTMLERPAFRRALVSGDLPQVFAKKKQFITELHKQLELVLAVGHRQKALRPDTDRLQATFLIAQLHSAVGTVLFAPHVLRQSRAADAVVEHFMLGAARR